MWDEVLQSSNFCGVAEILTNRPPSTYSVDTPGKRLYLIRLALGDGTRKPLPLREFATFVETQTGQHYDPSSVSLLERGVQPLSLADCERFAGLDPLRRGAAWLAFGIEPRGDIAPDPNARRAANDRGPKEK